jgi:CubicO group peptidase (beta-lactamase class C family)
MLKRCLLLLLCAFVGQLLFAQEITEQLNNYLTRRKGKSTFNGTVIVVYKGETLLHKGYGLSDVAHQIPVDTSTMFRIGSITKPFTATAILYLREKGKLSLNDPIAKYLPTYPNGNDITITHLLTHSSGIQDYLKTKEIQQAPDTAPPIALNKLISYFKDAPLIMQPGKKFSYSNSNYILLAAIIEQITGTKFENFVRSIIFEPLDMTRSGYDFLRLDSNQKATGYMNISDAKPVIDFDSTYAPGCGAMYSTVLDLYKWYRGLMSGRVLKDSTRESAFVPRQWKYGYGWFGYTLYGKRCISHAGGVPGFYANIQFFPDDDLFIGLLSNSSSGHIETDKIASIVFQKKFKSSGL